MVGWKAKSIGLSPWSIGEKQKTLLLSWQKCFLLAMVSLWQQHVKDHINHTHTQTPKHKTHIDFYSSVHIPVAVTDPDMS